MYISSALQADNFMTSYNSCENTKTTNRFVPKPSKSAGHKILRISIVRHQSKYTAVSFVHQRIKQINSLPAKTLLIRLSNIFRRRHQYIRRVIIFVLFFPRNILVWWQKSLRLVNSVQIPLQLHKFHKSIILLLQYPQYNTCYC